MIFSSLNKRLLLTRAAIPGIVVLLAVIALQRCDRSKAKEITDEHLRPGEKTAVIIDPNSRTVVAITNGTSGRNGIRSPLLRGRNTKPPTDSGEVVTRIDGARGIRISVSDEGTVSIIARTKGFCFEPGLGLYQTTSNTRIFIDTQFLFARRHGVNAGIGLGLRGKLNGAAFLAYSYNVWSNTSLLAGYDTKHEVLVGVRVRF